MQNDIEQETSIMKQENGKTKEMWLIRGVFLLSYHKFYGHNDKDVGSHGHIPIIPTLYHEYFDKGVTLCLHSLI